MKVYATRAEVPADEWPSTTPALIYDNTMPERVRRLLAGESFRHAGSSAEVRLDAKRARLVLACPTSRGGSGSWVPTRSAPRFLDTAWELIQEARRDGRWIRVLGCGPHTDDTITRYPWDAIVCASVAPEVVKAHEARWASRWWP